ncbi:hypothetical protein [Luteolibacter sp. Populi]|uniref:hypothetical protein n=1 Tax=Luteolibacter sp. Populi TaxID=3230487 RepID=UPI003465C387
MKWPNNANLPSKLHEANLQASPESFHALAPPHEVRDLFLGQANDVAGLYKAVMPDPVIPLLAPGAQVIAELAVFDISSPSPGSEQIWNGRVPQVMLEPELPEGKIIKPLGCIGPI